jgi:hypothetical protein
MKIKCKNCRREFTPTKIFKDKEFCDSKCEDTYRKYKKSLAKLQNTRYNKNVT